MANKEYYKVSLNTKTTRLIESTPEYRQRRMAGLTIIQLMLTLLVAGIVGALLVDFIIDKRCEDNPPAKLCADRKTSSK